LQHAAKLAGQLDAQPLLQQIHQLARRARIELTPDSSPTGSTPFGLTPRELEVLRLIAAGYTSSTHASLIAPAAAWRHARLRPAKPVP
jgi:ATP/maltotriose-dependent transcriptional regulator MalT